MYQAISKSESHLHQQLHVADQARTHTTQSKVLEGGCSNAHSESATKCPVLPECAIWGGMTEPAYTSADVQYDRLTGERDTRAL